MNCYKCATPVPENARFCSTCGTDVSGESHGHESTLATEGDSQLFAKLQEELGTDFILERELGRGGMAVVFLGRDAHLNRKVAVKVLPPELTYGGGGSTIERFKREAQTAAKLDHPNIIPVYRVSTGGRLFWYVMKYLDGEALNDILEREGQLPVERTVDIVSQVAAALDYAHQNQVVHRDVKPANVLVDKKGWCTVTDFGIAKALDASTLTASGSIIGTPYYMSPEQCKGKRVGAAADQYSLAVMTYQMLSAHLPFTGDSAVEIVHKHVADPVPPLGVLRPELPERVVAVVEKGLAKDAEDRFATTAEFAQALNAAAQGVGVQLAPPRKAAGPRLSRTALVSPVPGALRTAKGALGRRRLAMLAAAAVVAGFGVVAVVQKPWARGAAGGAAMPAAESLSAQTAAAGDSSAPGDAVSVPAAVQPAADTAAPVAEPAPAAALIPRPARLTLRGVPAGAVVVRDGARVRGSTMELEPGRRHIIGVTTSGFEPWADTVRPGDGERLTRTLTLRPATVAAAPAPAAAAQAQPQAQPPAAETPVPADVTPAPTANAFITVGSRPNAAMTINGRAAPTNPIANYEVPAGRVTIRFQVTDESGIWTVDTAFVVRSGERRNLGRITLRRP